MLVGNPDLNNRQRVRHLLSRMTFGVSFPEYQRYITMDWREVAEELLEKSKEIIHLTASPVSTDYQPIPPPDQRESRFALGCQMLNQMAFHQCGIREKVVLFWMDHFACNSRKNYYLQLLYNEFRTHALGDFRELTLAVSKSPAMILFLDNSRNRKDHPNENFTRELFELFTLGLDQYTESDIIEGAKAFTGWYFDEESRFMVKEENHDYGPKTVFGETGNFHGEDIIDLIFKQKAAPGFICGKIYQYFVNPDINQAYVNELSESFGKDFNLLGLFRKIMFSDWFYAPENIGVMVKSPFELVAGALAHLGQEISVAHYHVINRILAEAGQEFFLPPSVDGWAFGEEWLTRITLPNRLQTLGRLAGTHFAYMLLPHGWMGWGFKPFPVPASPWSPEFWDGWLAGIPDGDLLETVLDWLVINEVTDAEKEVLKPWIADVSRIETLQRIPALIQSVPGYQLS